MAITTKILERRVQNGADLLDRVYPTWYKRIDVTTLDLYDQYLCVLGQLYQEFCFGRMALLLDCDDTDEYGFSSGAPTSKAIREESDRLTLLWARAIEARRIS